MFTEMAKRKYTPRRRAEKQEETRQRIVEATVALHEEVGPRDASISAIAERAGVQRLTVYRHFPDEVSLFAACTGHWLDLNPPPDPAAWADVADPAARCRAALSAFYRYYRGTAVMWRGAWRDRDDVAGLQGPLAAVDAYLDEVAERLAAAWGVKGKRAKTLSAIARHALIFPTWDSLCGKRAAGPALSDAEAAALVATWMAAVAKSAAE
jgi:AcrR family transcriptional regulator